MFESGVTLPLLPYAPLTIKHVHNHIAGTTVVLWWKHFPESPKRYTCSKELNTHIVIPAIQQTSDLFGTHLECRLMRSDDDCWCRVLLWVDQKVVRVASPNDTDRNIDNLAFDLQTTKRTIPGFFDATLRFHTKLDHVFLDIGDHTVPIESVY